MILPAPFQLVIPQDNVTAFVPMPSLCSRNHEPIGFSYEGLAGMCALRFLLILSTARVII